MRSTTSVVRHKPVKHSLRLLYRERERLLLKLAALDRELRLVHGPQLNVGGQLRSTR
jgi:hypothetical protein